MTFDIVAKEIIRESISNALCIDDSFYEPYDIPPNEKDEDYLLSKELYEAFKKENCILDIYRYSEYELWDSVKENLLSNKELVVLDWELNNTKEIIDTLEVLSDIVKNDSVLFVYIYTRETYLGQILLKILSHYSSFSQTELQNKYVQLCKQLECTLNPDTTLPQDDADIDLDILDSNKIIDSLVENMKNMIISPFRYDDEYSEMLSRIKLDAPLKKSFVRKLKKIGSELFDCNSLHDDKYTSLKIFKNIVLLKSGLGRTFETAEPTEFNWVLDKSYTFLLNNKLIRIGTKKTASIGGTEQLIAPDDLFSDLSSAISKEPNNFLNLLGLEMRNVFRKGSSIVGRDFPTINELAFFHHEQHINQEDTTSFERFLLRLWEDDLSNYVHSSNLTIFPSLDIYKSDNDINTKLSQINRDQLANDLARLNYYYCVSRAHNANPRKIEFGDIFQLDIKNSPERKTSSDPYLLLTDDIKSKYEFLLCITQQCECLRPNKINYMYHFVGGVKLDLKSGLQKVDNDLISFLVPANAAPIPYCIKWHPKPFSIYINGEQNNVSNTLVSKICGQKLLLKHVDKLKENYAQKIANHAFSDASRIGIDFAKI